MSLGIRSRGLAGALSLAAMAGLMAGCSSRSSPSATTTSTSSTAAAAGTAVARGVVAAPILVAQTTDGTVAYRSVGRGTPLVLLTGLGATMDDWAPAFVNALALRHRVVMLDNAGVGMTASLALPTISAMADQTSALISRLELGPVDVLGWSMGGMIAQALAVRHPDQVARLVLAATQAGTGKALPIPPAAAAAASSSDVTTHLSVLFPADQRVAAGVYVAGILRYPDRYAVSGSVALAQAAALQQWFRGTDPSGPRVGGVPDPVLVADGTVDQVDPVANDQLLASLFPGATLVTYPDAGHAFLFQDEAAFVPRVEEFLA